MRYPHLKLEASTPVTTSGPTDPYSTPSELYIGNNVGGLAPVTENSVEQLVSSSAKLQRKSTAKGIECQGPRLTPASKTEVCGEISIKIVPGNVYLVRVGYPPDTNYNYAKIWIKDLNINFVQYDYAYQTTPNDLNLK